MITSNTSINQKNQSITTSNNRTVYRMFLHRAMLIRKVISMTSKNGQKRPTQPFSFSRHLMNHGKETQPILIALKNTGDYLMLTEHQNR